MYVIIKTDIKQQSDEILNIIYGEDHLYVEDMISKYYDNLIDNLNSVPKNGDINTCDYFVEIENGEYTLIKKYTTISKGYLYNNVSSMIYEKMYLIKVKDYQETGMCINLNKSDLWLGINSEINRRIIKQLDKESLYQIHNIFENIIKTKENWSRTELTMLQNKIVKDFKKELFSSIVKKKSGFLPGPYIKSNEAVEISDFSKKVRKMVILEKNKITVKNAEFTDFTTSGKPSINNLPDLSKFTGTACTLEYMLVEKKL